MWNEYGTGHVHENLHVETLHSVCQPDFALVYKAFGGRRGLRFPV